MPKPDIQQVSPVVAEQERERCPNWMKPCITIRTPHAPEKEYKKKEETSPYQTIIKHQRKKTFNEEKEARTTEDQFAEKELKEKKNSKSKKENHKQEENELQRNSHLLEKDHVLLKRVKHDDGRALRIGTLFRSTQSSSSA